MLVGSLLELAKCPAAAGCPVMQCLGIAAIPRYF
jgi:hypothetical protein